MRGGLLFLGIAILLFGLAANGLISDGVLALQRRSDDVILRAEQPLRFGFTIFAYAAFGLLMAGISAFLFWSRREQKAAEAKFFGQRRFLK